MTINVTIETHSRISTFALVIQRHRYYLSKMSLSEADFVCQMRVNLMKIMPNYIVTSVNLVARFSSEIHLKQSKRFYERTLSSFSYSYTFWCFQCQKENIGNRFTDFRRMEHNEKNNHKIYSKQCSRRIFCWMFIFLVWEPN